MRGPLVMAGYRNDPEKTAQAIDPDGWLRTGDIGELDADGYLRIVDRKKELIINAAGKNMSPANIESRLKAASPLIGQCICIGDRRPYNVALIVLEPDACAAHARARGLDDASAAALVASDEVQTLVTQAIDEANSHLARGTDQALHDPGDRLAARLRRAHTHHEAQAKPRQYASGSGRSRARRAWVGAVARRCVQPSRARTAASWRSFAA